MSKKTVFGLLAASAAVIAAFGASSSALTASAASAKPLVVVPSPNGNYQDNFNPFSGAANHGTDGLIYETLFYFDNVSGSQFDLLGTGYKWSNGNKTLTVTLRKNAKWSDGKPFTSADVAFSFNLLKKYSDVDTNGIWNVLSSVKATNSNTVVFNLKDVDGPFAQQYILGGTYIVPQHIWASLGDPSKANVTTPVGTGPFVMSSFTPQLYKMTANKNYYNGVSKVPEVDYPAFSGNDSADLSLAKGDVDWGGIEIPNIQKTYVSQNAHNHYYFAPDNVVELYANLQNPLLSQLPVREAISMAIDRNKVSTEGEYGYEKVASPTDLLLPNNNSDLDPKLPAADKTFTYNPSAAEKILQKAGFTKDSNGVYAKNGQELSFTLQVVSGWSDWDTDAELISQNLAKIGIKAQVQQLQYGAYYNNLMPTGKGKKNYQLAISWTNVGPTPYTLYENLLDTKGNYNVEQLNDPSISAILSNYSATSNATQQKQDLYKLEKYVAEQLPAIPLTDGALWYEYNDANYTGWPTQSNSWINGAPYTDQAAAIILMHLKPVN